MPNTNLKPIFKWVGGKRQLLKDIYQLLPPLNEIELYCEPFLGGGALFFALKRPRAIVNDLNSELILCYQVIRDDVENLIDKLKEHEAKHSEEYYYLTRSLDRDLFFYRNLSALDKSARLIYLNKTCYNGLFRVNAYGQFNAAYGNYLKPNIVNAENLRLVSAYFKEHDINFYSVDFEEVLLQLDNKTKTFVYLDPPYHPLSASANFTSYNIIPFDEYSQKRLKICCDKLNAQNIKFMLSNSDTNFTRQLYKNYHIHYVSAKRAINVNPQKRGKISELIITNY